jgi:hypothetical protein
MANQIYPTFKQAAYDGTGINLGTADVRVVLLDLADYTFNAADDFLSDIPAPARIASAALTGETWTGGVFDADDLSISGVTGDQFEGLALYIHTGVDATARLIAYWDSATGLPITPNSGGVDITWNNGASKIFAL